MPTKNKLEHFWKNKKSYDDETIKDKFKALSRMIPLIFKGEYKAKKSNLILGTLAALYAVSPLDFIPEIALGPFGLLDDIIILGYGVKLIDKEIERFLKWEEDERNHLLNR